MELEVGQVIAERYRVEQRLGSGAMGTVYRARHIKLQRAFAIKVLHPPLTANDKVRKRFQREAEIASSLRHRNVVGVIDIGETDHLVYLVMELADGVPLSEIMGQAPLSSRRVIDYMRQLCDGLAHAHAAGLVHRDFKPENVIVERDHAGVETLRIIDFGIAILRDHNSTDERERLTTEGVVLGTPHYMAPEHASGDQVDHRIDLFALGVICFEMMTGKMPFDGDGVDVARANMMYDAPAMGVRVPYLAVDPLLEALTRRLMARQRDRRIPTARAARDILDLIEKDRPAAAAALGLGVPTIDATAIAERPRQAIQVVARPTSNHVRLRGAPNTLDPHVLSTVPNELSRDTERVVPVRRRMLFGGGIAALVLAIVVAASLARSPSQITDTAERALHAPPPALAPPSIASAPAPRSATIAPLTVASRLAPTMLAPRVNVPPAMRPLARPAPIVRAPAITAPVAPRTIEVPPLAAPPAADVANLYGAVGRELGHLQQAKGSDATLDLWPRFRHIRINDAMMTSDARRDTDRLLRELERDVAARR